jgi:hypothetical protein
MRAFVGSEAEELKRQIVRGLNAQAPGGQPILPLSKGTIEKRKLRRFRGTKALLQRAFMMRSIRVKKFSGGPRNPNAFVGVLRTARAKDGRSLANIAEMNEFGSRPILIRITPKMRRFLFVLGRRVWGERTKRRQRTSKTGESRMVGGGMRQAKFYRRQLASRSTEQKLMGKGYLIVQIPARPFIRPAVERMGRFDQRFVRYMQRMLRRIGL